MLKTHVVKLNTENTNCFVYETEELLIELLGGIRVDTLDRVRVTMKVSVVNRKHPNNAVGTSPQYTSELADLAIRHNLQVIISFARVNNLPFQWQTGSGNFNAADDKYTNTKDFLLDVKQHSGAPDFANNANTTKVGLQDIDAGTVNVLTSEGRPSPNHVQVISSVSKEETPSMLNNFTGGVTGFVAAQGNFNKLDRVFGSDNPNSVRYLGVPVQGGVYNVKTNSWQNISKGETTSNFIGGHYKNEYRKFNFQNFNRK